MAVVPPRSMPASPPVGASPTDRVAGVPRPGPGRHDDRARPVRVEVGPWTPAPRHTAFRLWLAALAFLVVAALGTMTMPPALDALIVDDKLAHAFGFAALMALFARLFRGARERTALLVALLALGLGVECLQTLTETRRFEPLDLLANLVGALGVWWLLRGRDDGCPPRCESWLARALGGRSRARRAPLG